MSRIGLVLTLVVSVCSADVFVEERRSQGACEALCVNDYPLHTYPKPEHLKACERGCRLFSLVKISESDKDHKSDVKQTFGDGEKCYKACGEAYPEVEKPDSHEDDDHHKEKNGLKEHCEVGCHHGAEVHQKKQAKIQNQLRYRDPIMADLVSKLQTHDVFNSRPFQIMNQMMNDMMNEMNRAMSFSLSLEDQRPRVPVIAVRKEGDHPGSGVRVDVDQPGMLIIRTLHKSQPPSFSAGSVVSDIDDPFDDLRGSNTRYQENDQFPRIVGAAVKEQAPKSSDWLECISRKAGVPRWILLTSIFLCSLMFVWLCFAATGPVPEQRVYAISNSPPAYPGKQPWSEIPYVCPAYDKAALDKIADEVDKTCDKEFLIRKDEEAGELPAKIHFERV